MNHLIGGAMNHLSEVLKILEGALQHNVRKAADYAGLLADKLESDGNARQATMIRQKLARVPKQMFSPAAMEHSLPVDSESQLQTLDEELPSSGDIELVLPDNVSARLVEFIQSVRAVEKLAAAGIRHPARILFYGPPGCGKTQVARLIAAELGLPLLTVRCDTLVSSLLGQTSRNLRRVFEHAENRPCVLFLDEFDALAKSRSDEREIGELQRVVIALLQNIDALSPETVLIAATNHHELLDRAVWRRFAWHIPLALPDTALRAKIWAQKLSERTTDDVRLDVLAELSEGLSGAVIEHVAHDAIRSAILSGETRANSVDLLRRLGLLIAMTRSINLDSRDKEIEFLRQWAPRHLALRKLADYYGISVRQTDKAAKGEAHGCKS
jgi:SpoVK/Ycf46/Vps4 family AAA+-type ATPase